MNKIIYKGPFKDHIKNHIELKQAVGYKYDTDARHLKRFDQFTLEKYPFANVLTKEIVIEWCHKKAHETKANQCSRASVIRQLAKYIDSTGANSYILPKRFYSKGEQYTPHIYTTNELISFFKETDKCYYSSLHPYRHLIMPIFFRMIYLCGLRLSEARLLKVGNVDIENGILTINHSKKGQL